MGDTVIPYGSPQAVQVQSAGLFAASMQRPTMLNRLTGSDVETDVVLFAVGREPYVEGLGLDAAGVTLSESGAIAVDDYSRTSVENIWAVGDVTGRINLTLRRVNP